MRYRDRDGKRRLESTGTEDWYEANRVLRDRLQARWGFRSKPNTIPV
jgi:hypothetical protein